MRDLPTEEMNYNEEMTPEEMPTEPMRKPESSQRQTGDEVMKRWSRLAMSLWWLRWGIDLVVSSGKTTLAEEMPIARAMQECADEPSDSEVTAEGDEGDCEAMVKRRR